MDMSVDNDMDDEPPAAASRQRGGIPEKGIPHNTNQVRNVPSADFSARSNNGDPRAAFDPVDRVDAGIAWITMLRHPLLDPAAARVIAGERHDVGPMILLKWGGGSAAPIWIVDRLGHEPVTIVGAPEPLAVSRPTSGVLHQPNCLGR